MSAVISTSVLVLVVVATLEAKNCVCYKGQEPNQAGSKRYSFVIQTACECTEFRVGGVNMKPQVKPYEVMAGGVSKVKQELVRSTPDHRAPGTTQLPCPRSYTREPRHHQVEEPLDLPMRLEFSVQGPGAALVNFSPGLKGYQYAKFSVGLYSTSFSMFKREDDKSWTGVKSQHNLNIFGKPFFVTYDNGHIEAGVKDVKQSHVTYDLPSPPQADRMFIILENTESTEWTFFEPCIHFTLNRL